MKKFVITMAIFALGIVALPALAKDQIVNKVKVLKVGVLGPFTEPFSRVGEEFKNTIHDRPVKTLFEKILSQRPDT
jgi:hypothetical protein